MAQRKQVVAVYGAGLLQGLALVTFPAASAVFTDRSAYALTSGEYGAMFVPQTIMAISAALLGGQAQRRWGGKRVFLAGLGANLCSMALLVGSRFALGAHALAYPLLLLATALMGTGFGLTVPALNTLAAALFPDRVDVAVLALNALLGMGTALAPLLIGMFVHLGAWWGLPLAVGVLLGALLAFSLPLSLAAAGAAEARAVRTRRFWMFIAFAFGYGVVETLNGNWAILYMRGVLGSPADLASLALTLFWAMATAGRILFAAVERWLPARATFRLLPWAIGLALIAISLVPGSKAALGVAAFGFAGLGCSALLPLTISLGRGDAPAGHLIAGYQLGYGVAALGIAPLQGRAGIGLRTLFGAATGVALVLAVLAALLVGGGRRRTRAAPGPGRTRAAVRPSPSSAG
ncbi:MAG TPA: MFS transporter [Polyangia bacterium]|nr:MFS transporter [Polyangia bacterium]